MDSGEIYELFEILLEDFERKIEEAQALVRELE